MVPPASTIDFASSATSRNDSEGARSMYFNVTSTRVVDCEELTEGFAEMGLEGAEVAKTGEVMVSAVRRIRPSRSALASERIKS